MVDNILVTGADGFIGSHLVEILLSKGHKVRALSLYNSFNHWGWLEEIPQHKHLTIVSGDVRDTHFCRTITQDVDIVLHLAALIAIPYSYEAPDSYIDTNVKGTLNMCQAALENQVKRFVQLSTSEVYGTAQYVPICEKHPLQPQSPYSASKIGADAIAKSFHSSFDLPVTIARPFNTFGPRQSARAVIPTVITQIANGNNIIRLGNTTPTRDFTFVTDTCAGLLAIVESKKTIGETINIGSNFEVSIGDTVKLIAEIMGQKITIETEEERFRPENSEVYRLFCNNTKLRELTGFELEYTFEQGLEQTINWFKIPENQNKYKANMYNV